MLTKEYSLDVGKKTLVVQFTDLADQANGSVLVRYGHTTVLATVVMSPKKQEGLSYFPLTVDYEERFYAAGAILGSRFMRREGRPSDNAILSGRIVDRTIRPLFDHHIRNEVQVVITVLSIDEDDPDILAVNAASLALATSDIPWKGPVSAVRIGKHKKSADLEVNPSYLFRRNDDLEFDVIACGKDGDINMIEVESNEISEKLAAEAFEKASEEIEKIQTFQKKIIKEIGKEKKILDKKPLAKETEVLFEKEIARQLEAAVFSDKGKAGINELKDLWLSKVSQDISELEVPEADDYFEEQVDALIHTQAIEHDRRADGRAMDKIRKLYAKAGEFSEILHGSGIFYRGGTHVFSTLTLGGPGDSLLINSIEIQEGKKRFMHHYNFPPFSVGETGRIGGLNRRMIGHGALAEKALAAVIPPQETFPYTIRLVSESMASNGSTSMASVCAGTLALMDGGVPILRPVAGIALGLMMKDKDTYKILTDIQGPEDHFGDMDFKIAGTREGITAIQMDVKVGGIPMPILKEALEAGKKARLTILDVIEAEISAPRPSISPQAPEILTLIINPEKIGTVIGPGGKTINKIRDDTGVEDITIEDDGSVFITGKNGTAEKAKNIIGEMTREYKAGERFEGTVTRITDFGAFVRIGSTTEGLVHISEVAPFRIKSVNGILKEGDRVPVIIKEVDEKNRINLSIKDADANFAQNKGATPEKRQPSRS